MSRATLDRRVARGEIPVVRDGGRYIRFRQEDLDAFIMERRKPSLSEALGEPKAK